jgi:hypothetical protein
MPGRTSAAAACAEITRARLVVPSPFAKLPSLPRPSIRYKTATNPPQTCPAIAAACAWFLGRSAQGKAFFLKKEAKTLAYWHGG